MGEIGGNELDAAFHELCDQRYVARQAIELCYDQDRAKYATESQCSLKCGRAALVPLSTFPPRRAQSLWPQISVSRVAIREKLSQSIRLLCGPDTGPIGTQRFQQSRVVCLLLSRMTGLSSLWN